MENNPFQTPKSDVGDNVRFKRSAWWKIYFFFITIISAAGMASLLADPKAGISEYINLVIWLVATAGLFGFVFIKPIYKPRFWLLVFIVYIVYGVIYYFIAGVDLRTGMSDAEFYVFNAIAWLLSVPAYYGLFAFSRPAYPAWKNV